VTASASEVLAGKVQVPTAGYGGDSAYALSIRTGLSQGELSALSISAVEFTLDVVIAQGWGNNDTSAEVQMYRGVKTADTAVFPSNGPKYVCGFDWSKQFTTSGAVEDPMHKRWDAPRGTVLLAGEWFTIRIDTSGTGVRNGVYYRIFYKKVGITLNQYITLMRQNA